MAAVVAAVEAVAVGELVALVEYLIDQAAVAAGLALGRQGAVERKRRSAAGILEQQPTCEAAVRPGRFGMGQC